MAVFDRVTEKEEIYQFKVIREIGRGTFGAVGLIEVIGEMAGKGTDRKKRDRKIQSGRTKGGLKDTTGFVDNTEASLKHGNHDKEKSNSTSRLCNPLDSLKQPPTPQINKTTLMALKIVYQSRRHKNRELAVWRKLNHENITSLYKYSYYMAESGDTYLYLFTEYIPNTLTDLIKEGNKISLSHYKSIFYSLINGLEYLHKSNRKICHRDLKPSNILIEPKRMMSKICDFGCAKKLDGKEKNISYICARYYRPPEALLGYTDYNCRMDIWSYGCLLIEVLIGKPIFQGKNTDDQLKIIYNVLIGRNKDYSISIEKLDKLSIEEDRNGNGLNIVLANTYIGVDGIDLIKQILCYNPKRRLSATKIKDHIFFKSSMNS
eukprot:GHVP01059298.1.p1 GENE.GHVP01059298.1~~GHVP01059298.1.p1  ORF type:complete len:415 (-),score=43.74 GHVP01059298.1:99-1226(-)